MSKVVTVFGATGGQGGGVVSRLLKAINNDEGDYHIRAITRNPDGPKGIDLKNKGCEVVKCDMDDQASVEEAIGGSYAVFLVTNYWEHFSAEKEIDQGKRVIDVSEKLGVKHLVYSGLENVKKSIGLECGESFHFNTYFLGLATLRAPKNEFRRRRCKKSWLLYNFSTQGLEQRFPAHHRTI